MKCQNCKKELPDDSKFCEHCGKKINKEEPKKIDSSKSFDEIKNHLEFIGYESDDNIIDDKGIVRFAARHKHRPNLFISDLSNFNVILLVSMFSITPIKKESDQNEFLQLINKINNDTIITTFCVGNNFDNFTCATWYPNTYSKKTFSDLLELFEAEINSKINTEELQKFA